MLSSGLWLWLCLFLVVCVALEISGGHIGTKKRFSSRQTKPSRDGFEFKASRNNGYIPGNKFLGTSILEDLTFASYGVTLGPIILQAIKGCSATYPSITQEFEEFQKFKDESFKIRRHMTTVSRLATERQIMANTSFYSYIQTRDLILTIVEEETQFVKSLGPEFLDVIKNVSTGLEKIFEAAVKANKNVDIINIYTMFSEGLDLGLRLPLETTSTAIPGLRKLWDGYLKDFIIGKNIVKFLEKSKVKVLSPAGSEAMLRKLLSKRKLLANKSTIETKLNNLIAETQPLFAKAKNTIEDLRPKIFRTIKAGNKALAAWRTVETYINCTEKSHDTKLSVINMTKNILKMKEFVESLEKANGFAHQAWKLVYDVTMEDDLVQTLEDMKSLMSADFFSLPSNNGEKGEVARNILEYIKVKTMNPNNEDTQEILSSRQRGVNKALRVITDTFSCWTTKGKAFSAVKRECAKGSSPFKFILKDIVNQNTVDPTHKCRIRTGRKHVSEGRMVKAWTKWLRGNGTNINEVCLMNDDFLVEQVKDFLRQKQTNVTFIAGKLLREDQLQKGGSEEIAAMVNEIKTEVPGSDLPTNDQLIICNIKQNEQDVDKVVRVSSIVVNRQLSVQAIDQIKCW